MLYEQKTTYQNFNGSGRDCLERYMTFKSFINDENNFNIIDIGAAEGWFVFNIKNDFPKTKIKAVEASPKMVENLLEKCKNLKDVSFFTQPMDENNISEVFNKKYDLCLLLSVLHWFENPEFIFEYVCSKSEKIVFEFPNLDDKNSYNQEFLNKIKENYGNTENFIKSHCNKNILEMIKVKAHSSSHRNLYLLG